MLEDLKRSANLGRDEYPETLTEAFNLLVRESGEYDTVRTTSTRYRPRGGRGGRGRQIFCLRSKAAVVAEMEISRIQK